MPVDDSDTSAEPGATEPAGHPPASGQACDEQETDRDAMAVGDEMPPRLAFPVVGVGASAGGLEAYSEFLDAAPADAGIAFVLIQHLAPQRESMLVDLLSKHTAMPVSEVVDGTQVEPDHVYIIRPGHVLTIKDGRLHLGESLRTDGNNHPVDDFFRSLAEEQRERAIAVVLSGMGSNGTAGAREVKAVGGVCLAQSPESAKFPSMPRSLIDAGLADFVMTPAEMPRAIAEYARHPYATGTSDAEQIARRERQALGEVLAVLRTRANHDFGGYKKPTVVRRIQRRMSLGQHERMGDYARALRNNPAEIQALADDLQIHVTGFFRDAEAWEILASEVIAPLVAERADDAEIRAWITACSSGEEAYTLGILLLEAAERAGKQFDIKIFATDTAERSLAQARAGVFPGGIETEVSAERIERFFDRLDGTFRVKKELRELVVFAPQNVMQDPPFSRLDIATCRNLLIYLEPEVQRRVLSLLHFGLKEGGALMLGTSETIHAAGELFEPIDKKWRLYRRIGQTRHGALDFPPLHEMVRANGDSAIARRAAQNLRPVARASVGQLANLALLEHFTPPTVVIDRLGEVVYFHGDTNRFLSQPRGEPTREILALSKESVRGAVRAATHKAIATNESVTAPDGLISDDEGHRLRVEVTAAPLEGRPGSGYFLVSFTAHREPAPAAAPTADPDAAAAAETKQELGRLREELQSTVEELQTSNEEMKASNEEITSVNEELQSTNEELETSKEELQSLNEELTTVNAQLHAKMEELERTTNDLSSLLSSTDIAVVFLDRGFRIRRFTPAVLDLFELIPGDVGRPLNDLDRKFEDPDLLDDARAVLDKLVPIEREVRSESGRWYVRRTLVYRTGDNRIDGVVVTFVDFTARKRAEESLRDSESGYRMLLEGVRDFAILMLNSDGQITMWNAGATELLGWTEAEALGRSGSLIFTPEDRTNGATEREMATARRDGRAADERWHLRKNGERFWGSGVMASLVAPGGEPVGFVKVMRDGTRRKRDEDDLRAAKASAEAANAAKDDFLANVSHELRTPLSAILLWSKLLASGGAPDAEQLAEGISAIERSARAQQTLIDDLLDTTRIAAGKIRLERRQIDLRGVVRAACDAVRPAAEAKELHLDVQLGEGIGPVRADPERLQQVVWNLLSNAVKFTPGGGRIELDLRRSDGHIQGTYQIRVRDSGAGIAADFLPRLFERFGQAEGNAGGARGGLGLGLAISRQLVELHGGTIDADSDGAGKGATFTVTLPLGNVEEVEQSGEDRPLAGTRVLLVDADADARRRLEAALTGAGANVDATDSLQTALLCFDARRPVLIVADVALAGDGLMRQVRTREAHAGLAPAPAVGLGDAPCDSANAAPGGFDRCLQRPADGAALVALLAALRARG